VDIQLHYDPFPVHEPFHRSNAREKALIGAVGSGKTYALVAEAAILALTQPGSRILVCRATVPALRDTTEYEFVRLLNTVPDELDGVQHSTLYDLCELRREAGHLRQINFPNGSEVLFRALDDWKKIMSFNLAAVFIDEASEINAETYNGLLTRLRQQEPTPQAKRMGTRWDPATVRQQMCVATNPNGHDWVYQYFVANDHPDRRYWRSTSFDNPTLFDAEGNPNAYVRSLLSMPEVWIKRYVMCEFNDFEGQILAFRPEEHVVDHFTPPPDWERAMGIDWGIRSPTAAVWWARPRGTTQWYQYREWLSHNPMDPNDYRLAEHVTVHTVAQQLRAIEKGERIRWRACDPSMDRRQADSGKSLLYWFGTYGYYFTKGVKDYDSRINALNTLLINNDLRISQECNWTTTQMQQYHWSKINMRRDTDAPTKPHKKDDHLVDASEYLATIFMFGDPAPTTAPEPTWDDYIRNKVHDQARRQSTPRPGRLGWE
jgi:PBSX family phage terminase large subunit